MDNMKASRETVNMVKKVRELAMQAKGKQSMFLKLIQENTPNVEVDTKELKITLPVRVWELIQQDAETSSHIEPETEADVEIEAILSLLISGSDYGRRSMEKAQQEAPLIVDPNGRRDN